MLLVPKIRTIIRAHPEPTIRTMVPRQVASAFPRHQVYTSQAPVLDLVRALWMLIINAQPATSACWALTHQRLMARPRPQSMDIRCCIRKLVDLAPLEIIALQALRLRSLVHLVTFAMELKSRPHQCSVTRAITASKVQTSPMD